MEFASGTGESFGLEKSSEFMIDCTFIGLVTRELVPYVKNIIGVDISSGSIDKFNENVVKHQLPESKIQGKCLELKGQEGELNDQKFDVILVGCSYIRS